MSRFVAIDLAGLAPPTAVVPPVYEALVAARKQSVVDRVTALDAALGAEIAAVLGLESEPLTKDVEAGAYRELLVYQRINEAVRAVLLATSTGADLDNLAARLGVLRHLITPANPATGTPARYETDAALRYRYQLALEAFSVAGPEGAYEFHARSTHPHVKDAACYGPESGLVDPGQTKTVLLSHIGTGAPAQEVIDAVLAKLTEADTVPDTDEVFVTGATITSYAIAYHLQIRPGADPALIVAASKAALEAYAADCHRVGRIVTDSGLDRAAHIDRTNVVRATRSSPVGEVNPGKLGAAWCTGVTVTYEIVSG